MKRAEESWQQPEARGRAEPAMPRSPEPETRELDATEIARLVAQASARPVPLAPRAHPASAPPRPFTSPGAPAAAPRRITTREHAGTRLSRHRLQPALPPRCEL